MSYTVVTPDAIQLDLTQAELIWLLRFLKIPTLPGMLPGLAELPMTSDAEGGAMIMALQSLQIRGLVTVHPGKNGQDRIDLDTGVIGILGSAIRATQIVFISYYTENGVQQTNCYLLPEMSIVHEQPRPFAHRFTTSIDKTFVQDRILSVLNLPQAAITTFEEHTIGRDAMLAARSRLLQSADRDGAASILVGAGWSHGAAETFLAVVGDVRANVLVTVVDTNGGDPRTSAAFELLVTESAVFYLYGEETIQIGSANAQMVMGSLLQLTPTLQG